jgi:hypothetical protein
VAHRGSLPPTSPSHHGNAGTAALGPLPPITPPQQVAPPPPAWQRERDNQHLSFLLGEEEQAFPGAATSAAFFEALRGTSSAEVALDSGVPLEGDTELGSSSAELQVRHLSASLVLGMDQDNELLLVGTP